MARKYKPKNRVNKNGIRIGRPVKKTPVVEEKIIEPIEVTQPSNEQSKISLFERIAKAGNTANENLEIEIPKGEAIENEILKTEVENEIQQETTEENRPEQSNATTSKESKPKGKRGRPKKEFSEPATPARPEKRVDLIYSMLEGLAFPIVAKKTHKEYTDLKFSKDQQQAIMQLQPDVDLFSKPSWLGYSLMTISFAVANFMSAAKDAETLEREKIQREMKKQNDRLNNLENNRTYARPDTTEYDSTERNAN